MHYTIRHVTRFTYDTPITESVMEARMQPRSEGAAALPPLRAEHDAGLARDDVPGPRRQHRPPLQHPRPARAADASRREALVECDAACRCPRRWTRTPGSGSTR